MTVYDLAAALPDGEALRARCRAIAMTEAIVSPDWQARAYGYYVTIAPGEQTALMRDGTGDEFSVVFNSAGVFIRGFDHESLMGLDFNDRKLWPGLTDGLPEVFAPQLRQLAFCDNGILLATFCLWRQTTDSRWQTGTVAFPAANGRRPDPDGASMLDILCDPTPRSLLAFIADRYQTDLDRDAVAHIWALLPLTDEIVDALNPGLTLAGITADTYSGDYPTAGSPDRPPTLR